MTLKEFIKKYDKQHAVVLLEGKRNVLETDKEKLTALGKLLATKTKKNVVPKWQCRWVGLLFFTRCFNG